MRAETASCTDAGCTHALPARIPRIRMRHELQRDGMSSSLTTAMLERDGFSSHRHHALTYSWSMMFSENRYPLFGITL